MTSEERATARSLATGLIEGGPVAARARDAGIEIAAEYWILAVAIDAARAEENDTDHRYGPAHTEFARRFPECALSVLSRHGGTLLIPVPLARESELSPLIDEMSGAAGVPITATVVRSGADAIPEGADRAHELLDLARRFGSGAGLHRFVDLAVLYQLTRPGPALDRLRALLDPLDGEPDLVATLRCHLANELSRQRTARMLNLHPNSIDYRLKRIARLTGLDATEPIGQWYLRSSLIVRGQFRQPLAGALTARI